MKKILISAGIVLLAVSLSCNKEKVEIPGEPIKEITGSWKIVKALRNGTDLTQRFDFSAFRIKFADSSYTIENQVPFIVNKNGNWRFNDPQYPFEITFNAAAETKKSAIQYPVVNGVRNIVITFSPGCYSNTYQYTLQKDN